MIVLFNISDEETVQGHEGRHSRRGRGTRAERKGEKEGKTSQSCVLSKDYLMLYNHLLMLYRKEGERRTVKTTRGSLLWELTRKED